MPETAASNSISAAGGAWFRRPARWLGGWLRQLFEWTQPWEYGPEEERHPVLTCELRAGVLLRMSVIGALMAGVFAWMLKHAYDVQVIDHEKYSGKALAICRSQIGEVAQRGRIFDRDGNLLAGNVATQNIYVEPKRFAGRLEEVTHLLAQQLDLDYDLLHRKFLQAIRHPFSYRVKDGLTWEEIESLKLLSIEGVRIRPMRATGDAADGLPKFSVHLSFPPTIAPAPTAGKKSRARSSITPQITRSCQQLASALQLDPEDLIAGCSRTLDRCKELVLKRNASREEADALLAALRELRITSGVRVTDSWSRSYPRNSLFANMLGFISEGDAGTSGVSGIEKLMDTYLQPTSGKYTYLHDGYGVLVEDEITCEVEPRNGADVFLTIREPLQQIVEEELGALWEKFRPDHAYGILMDPSTGAVLALAQYPQFNPNDRGTLGPMGAYAQNYCLINSYEPGSIMKPISLSALLENRLARLDTVVDCEHGFWRYGGAPLRDSHAYDNLTFSEVIKKSSNIGTAKLALELGNEKMHQHLASFGFGRRTGLGFYPEEGKPAWFTNEAPGIFRPLRQWRPISITRMSIGQSINATPLQIMQAWSVLANDGIMMQPHIVDHVRYPDGRTIYGRPFAKSRPISRSTARQLREALKTVTQEGGTGARAAIKGFAVAGKTGTAQILQPADPEKGTKAGYNNTDYLASFVGFVPADNPRFVLLVSAEHPTAVAHTGASVSAPTFRKIAERTLEYLQVAPDVAPMPEHSVRTAKR